MEEHRRGTGAIVSLLDYVPSAVERIKKFKIKNSEKRKDLLHPFILDFFLQQQEPVARVVITRV